MKINLLRAFSALFTMTLLGFYAPTTASAQCVPIIAPLIVCPADLSVELSLACEFTIEGTLLDATAADNCGPVAVTNSVNAGGSLDGVTLNAGVNVILFTATNAVGTSSCELTVTLTDAVDPVIVCPDEPTRIFSDEGECGAEYTFTLPTATDLCGIERIAGVINRIDTNNVFIEKFATLTEDSLTVFLPVGRYRLIWRARDVNDNIAACGQVFNVQSVINTICQNLTLTLDETGTAQVITADSLDGGSTSDCGPVTVALDQTTFGCADVGVNNVALTVTDNNGDSRTCIAQVTVLDTFAPVLINCPTIESPLFVDPGQLLDVEFTLPEVEDNCGIATLTGVVRNVTTGLIETVLDGETLTASLGVGTYQIIFRVRDEAGNLVRCVREFEILEGIPFGGNNGTALQVGRPYGIAGTQVYPNPSTGSTFVSYQLPADARVSVTISNMFGQNVETLFSGTQFAGEQKLEWTASDALANGLYLISINVEGQKVQGLKVDLAR